MTEADYEKFIADMYAEEILGKNIDIIDDSYEYQWVKANEMET